MRLKNVKKVKDYDIIKKKEKLFKSYWNEIKNNIILVEGLKDKREFIYLGIDKNNVYTISGHMENRCEKLKNEGVRKVIVLTDMDRTGKDLGKRTIAKLDSLAIEHTNLQTCKNFANLLHLRYWETLSNKIEMFNYKFGLISYSGHH